MSKKPLPPTYFFSSLFVMMGLHFWFPLTQIIKGRQKLFGCIPLILGIVLNLLADGAFKKNETTVKPFEESKALVKTGAYSLSRNPMYLGMFLMLLAVATFLGSLTPFAVIPVTMILIQRIFVREEEKMLERQFGDTWQEYKRKVRRWI